jgi:NADP-dependent 3-hydroxy acid dehydrogenase YdfG
MKTQREGHIVNIGSMSAETHEETGTVYVATKSAIRGFSAALRKEVNELGIKVSLIEPGAVTSDMQPAPKEEQRKQIEKMEMLEAEDIAMSVLFCLSQPKRSDIVSLQVRPHLQVI